MFFENLKTLISDYRRDQVSNSNSFCGFFACPIGFIMLSISSIFVLVLWGMTLLITTEGNSISDTDDTAAILFMLVIMFITLIPTIIIAAFTALLVMLSVIILLVSPLLFCYSVLFVLFTFVIPALNFPSEKYQSI